MTEYGKPAIFFTLEINALPEDKFQALLQDSQVAYYAPWLKRVRMFKPYELSEDIEALLADKALTSSAAWVRLYDETASKLKYVVDGKEYNDAEISKLLQDKDPLVREKAGKELNRVNKENGELFTFIYNMIVKDGAIEDENAVLNRRLLPATCPTGLRMRLSIRWQKRSEASIKTLPSVFTS